MANRAAGMAARPQARVPGARGSAPVAAFSAKFAAI